MNRPEYQWYKAHRICPQCGRRDADQGFVWCGVCREKYRARYRWSERKNYVENKNYYIDRQRKVRAARLAAGLCTQCGKRPPREGLQSCQKCADARKLRAMRQKYREIVEAEKD
jgi:hypothetical protein